MFKTALDFLYHTDLSMVRAPELKPGAGVLARHIHTFVEKGRGKTRQTEIYFQKVTPSVPASPGTARPSPLCLLPVLSLFHGEAMRRRTFMMIRLYLMDSREPSWHTYTYLLCVQIQ